MGKKRKRSAQDIPVTTPALKKQQKAKPKTLEENITSPTLLDTAPFVNESKGADLKREVQLYDILGSEDVSDRLNAANAIVSGLLGEDGVEESTLQRHLERRLFRGLASGRKGSRLGFSIVLTELLAQLFGPKSLSSEKYKGLTFEKVLGFLIAKTKPDGDLSGQEEKDHHFGMLFGLQSFVRAKILFEDNDWWNTILEKLLELAKRKPWIREECGWVIVEALAQMNNAQAQFTLEQLIEAGLAVSPEGVGIWLTAQNRFPDLKLPSKPWGKTGNPLENLQLLGKALKESSSNDNNAIQQAKQTGNWNPQLHFVWNLVLAEYATASKRKLDFEHFWKVAVDDNLFSASASRERKFWGFLLFQKILQDNDSYGTLVSSIFSHNLVRCLINHAQQQDRSLNRAAEKSLKVLVQAVDANHDLLPIVLPRLIGSHGIYNFDKVTKQKTIEKLLGNVEKSNAEEIVRILLEPAKVIKGIDDPKDAEMRRLVLGDYLLNIIQKATVSDDFRHASWIKDVALPTLVRIAYTQDLTYQPPISDKTRTIFKTRLMSAINLLLKDLSLFDYSCDLLDTFTPDAIPMDEGITEAKDDAISTMQKISKKLKKASDEEKAPLQALALLYSLVIFQLYNGEPEAVEILAELKTCYNELVRHRKREDSEVDASVVLIELLKSFVSQPSALLRKVTELVFTAFSPAITSPGLGLLTEVLESEESLRGQQSLFDQEPENEDEMEIDDDDELDSDVEVVDMEADEGEFNGRLEDSEEDDSETEEVADVDDEEGRKLDQALALALGTKKLEASAEDDSDSDADMTDSEMMALDSKLVEIFSQRKKTPNKKQEQKDAKDNMVNFKSRVLDLFEIYVKKQASNPLAFELLLPLLKLIRTTKTKQLSEKALKVITVFKEAFKGAKSTGTDTSVSDLKPKKFLKAQIKLLESIHIEASKSDTHIYGRAASSASILVASSIYRVDKDNVEKITTVYGESQIAWVKGERKLQAAFFVDWINWSQSHANASK